MICFMCWGNSGDREFGAEGCQEKLEKEAVVVLFGFTVSGLLCNFGMGGFKRRFGDHGSGIMKSVGINVSMITYLQLGIRTLKPGYGMRDQELNIWDRFNIIVILSNGEEKLNITNQMWQISGKTYSQELFLGRNSGLGFKM